MNPTFAPMKMNRYDWLKIAILLLIFAGGLIAGYQILKPMRSLPIYNPSDLDPRLVQSGMESKSKNHHTQPFALLNQYGDSITEKNLEGKIYVADFFFTSCPGICKDMAVQKRRLQKEFENENRFVLVSHSVTPVSDSVPVMREYAELQGAIQGKWQLLTGDKPQIYRLARQSYFAVLDEGGRGDEADFIHTENFVLVDTQNRIRGFYDGTSQEEVSQLIKDINLLINQLSAD